jgi:hypothetical protein
MTATYCGGSQTPSELKGFTLVWLMATPQSGPVYRGRTTALSYGITALNPIHALLRKSGAQRWERPDGLNPT